MRFDRKVYLLKVCQGKYDVDTGNYSPDTVKEIPVMANITYPKAETINLVYGTLKQDVYTVRLRCGMKENFDYIRIGDRVFRVDSKRELPTMRVYIVSEVQ